MTLGVLLPTLGCLTFAWAIGRRPLSLHPAWSARLLMVTAVAAALSVTATVGVLAAASLVAAAPHQVMHVPALVTVAGHRSFSGWIGAACLVGFAVGGVSVGRAVLRIVTERRSVFRIAAGLAQSHDPVALAVPGRRGGVLVSAGMHSHLSPAEVGAVVAHEQSHLRHAHHRYLAAVMICSAALPPLRQLEASLRFAIERWADEDAAVTVGDRKVVAQAVARAALTSSPERAATAGFSEVGVLARVEALLANAPVTSPFAGGTLVTTAGLASSGMTSSALQLHHLGVL